MPWSPFGSKKPISESNPTSKGVIDFGREKKALTGESLVYYIPGEEIVTPKGKVMDERFAQFKKRFGEPHKENYLDNELIYNRTPIVRGAIDKHEDFVVGNGFSFKIENDIVKKEVEDFSKAFNLDTLIRVFVRHGLTYGNPFIELINGKKGTPIVGWAIRDPKTMFIKRDEYGVVTQFNQINYKMQKEPTAIFEPKELLFIPFNKLDDSPYGTSIIEPVRTVLTNKLNFENDLVTLMDRKANNPFIFNMGTETQPATQADINALKADVETLNNQNEWIFDERVKVSVADTGNIAQKFDGPLSYFDQQILYALQVPAVLMGAANIPEGLAKAQLETWELRIKSIQEMIEKELINKIFSVKWPGIEIDIIWGLPSELDRQNEVIRLTELLKTFGLTPEIKLAVNKKIATLLELDVDIDNMTMPEEQPPQPFGNVDTSEEQIALTPADLDHIQELAKMTPLRWDLLERTYQKDSIKEATNLAHPFQQIILRQLEREQFDDIDYLTPAQREELRNILKGAVRNELSISAIKGKIEKRLGKVILKHLADDFFDRTGKIPNNKDMEHLKTQVINRAELIARTEIIRASNESALKAYQASNVVEKVQFLTAQDERVDDEICAPKNLKIYEFNNVPMPPLHPGCRCTLIPILK